VPADGARPRPLQKATSAQEATSAEGAVGRRPTIYDVARAAGVATSTVSRALSNPGRVSFKTAEHVRRVAKELGYRSELFEREVPDQRTKILAMIVADINNPVFHGMVRGAERTAAHDGYTVLVVETQESGAAEQSAVQRVLSSVDGIILTSSRMSDSAIRAFAKQRPLVVMNRVVESGRLGGKRQRRSDQTSRRAPSQLWCWSHHLPCRAASLLG